MLGQYMTSQAARRVPHHISDKGRDTFVLRTQRCGWSTFQSRRNPKRGDVWVQFRDLVHSGIILGPFSDLGEEVLVRVDARDGKDSGFVVVLALQHRYLDGGCEMAVVITSKASVPISRMSNIYRRPRWQTPWSIYE